MQEAANILIIESADSSRPNAISKILMAECAASPQSCNFEISAVSDLKSASEQLTNNKYQATLIDLALADIDEVLRLKHEDPDTAMIVFIDEDQEPQALTAIQNGVQDYIVKDRQDGYVINRAIRYAIERKKFEDRLRYFASFDHLTGLINRNEFTNALEKTVQNAGPNKFFAVLLLGLDRFKQINETLGYDGGDEVLRELATRLKKHLSKLDTVAHLGGDEFAIILESVEDIPQCHTEVENLLRVIKQDYHVDGKTIHLNGSIGVATYPDCGNTAKELVTHVDTAMGKAKAVSGSSYKFYKNKMSEGALEKLILENHLRGAIDKQEFKLYYQPQICTKTQKCVGVEALIRWENDELGFISPAHFVPLAENIGVISDIGGWVMETACIDNKMWQSRGVDIPVSVNISAKQFVRKSFVEQVSRVIKETGINKDNFVIEITESAVMDDAVASATSLFLLREMGIKIHIDDFGTGYSSMNYLKIFPLDALKIDKSFVNGVPKDKGDIAICSTIITLAKNLGLHVIAEGVEDKEQADYLAQNGCDVIQGYYYSKPMPQTEFLQWLNEYNNNLNMHRVTV